MGLPSSIRHGHGRLPDGTLSTVAKHSTVHKGAGGRRHTLRRTLQPHPERPIIYRCNLLALSLSCRTTLQVVGVGLAGTAVSLALLINSQLDADGAYGGWLFFHMFQAAWGTC